MHVCGGVDTLVRDTEVIFDFSGKTVEDGKCQDRVPLLYTGKRHVRYTPEEGEEMEDGVPVTCCSCDHCVIL